MFPAKHFSKQIVNPVALISGVTAVLVAVLAAGAFALSYEVLYGLASTHGVETNSAWLWPLLLDFAMIVFSLAILRANLRRESALYPWILTVVYAGLATTANVFDVAQLHIPEVVIDVTVRALPPISLVLAFELFVKMLRAELERNAVTKSMAALLTEQEKFEAEFKREQQNEQNALEELRQKQWKEQEKVDGLEEKKAKLSREITALERGKKRQPVAVGDKTKDQARKILTERPGISGAELGDLLGKSDSLGRKLKRELQRELLPEIPVSPNGNGTRPSSGGVID